jgi:hypothetical protein
LTQPSPEASLASAVCAFLSPVCSDFFRRERTRESILTAYPFLEDGDIDEPLRYAADVADDVTVELIH